MLIQKDTQDMLQEPKLRVKKMMLKQNQCSQHAMVKTDQDASRRRPTTAKTTFYQRFKMVRRSAAPSNHFALKTQVWLPVSIAMHQVSQLFPNIRVKKTMLKQNQYSQLVMVQMDQDALRRRLNIAQRTFYQNFKTVKKPTAPSSHFALKTQVWLLVSIASHQVLLLFSKLDQLIDITIITHTESIMKRMTLKQSQYSQHAMVKMDQDASRERPTTAKTTFYQRFKTVRRSAAPSNHFALKIQVWLLVSTALHQVLLLFPNTMHQVDLLLHNILSDINITTDITIQVKMILKLQHHSQIALELQEMNQELTAEKILEFQDAKEM